MEEGSLTRSLLAQEKSNEAENFEKSDSLSSNGSSATVVAVFSTLVALYAMAVLSPEWARISITLIVFQTGYSSPAESGIMEDLDLSVEAYSVFGSIVTAGGMIGGLVSGKLTDLIGCRGAMWISQVFNAVGWFAIAFSKNAWWLDFGRFLLGVGVGLISYVVPVYLAEITPKNLRGRFTSANQLLICCGISLMFFVGNSVTWRLLAIIGAIPCLFHILGLFFIPESPRWLAKRRSLRHVCSVLEERILISQKRLLIS